MATPTLPAIFTDVQHHEEFILHMNHERIFYAIERTSMPGMIAHVTDLGFSLPPRAAPELMSMFLVAWVRTLFIEIGIAGLTLEAVQAYDHKCLPVFPSILHKNIRNKNTGFVSNADFGRANRRTVKLQLRVRTRVRADYPQHALR